MGLENNIPEGWLESTLEELTLINPKESITKGSLAKNVPMDCIDSFTRKISRFGIREFKGGTKFKNKDTLFARITPCLENGKTALVDFLDKDEIGFGSTEYIVFRENKNKSHYKFIYYLSISPKLRAVAIKAMTGTSGRQRVQTDLLIKKMFRFPPLPEQKAIAKVLTAFDDKIELLQAQNKTLETMAQTIFKEWFGKYQIGDELPEGWRVGELGDILEIKYGKDHKHLKEGDYPLYGSGGIMRYVEKPLYDKESILIPRKGTLTNLFYLSQPFWSVDTMFYSKIKSSFQGRFIFLFLKSIDLASMNVGSAVPSLTTQVLNQISLIIPEDEAINKFNNLVFPFYNKIGFNNSQIQSLTKTRDTLLPKLMSGQVRVKFIKQTADA